MFSFLLITTFRTTVNLFYLKVAVTSGPGISVPNSFINLLMIFVQLGLFKPLIIQRMVLKSRYFRIIHSQRLTNRLYSIKICIYSIVRVKNLCKEENNILCMVNLKPRILNAQSSSHRYSIYNRCTSPLRKRSPLSSRQLPSDCIQNLL